MKSRIPLQILPGSMLRVNRICNNPKTGAPGLLPTSQRTWYRWVSTGQVPQGTLIGKKTRAWPVETVLAIGRGETVVTADAEDGATPSKGAK